MSGIRLLHTQADKAAFAGAIAGKPFFQSLLGRDLQLWADNPGAATQLYVLPRAALALSGRSAQLCGPVEDWEELTLFLRFAGVEKLVADRPAPLPLRGQLHLFGLGAGQSLPLAAPPADLTLDRAAPPWPTAWPGSGRCGRPTAAWSAWWAPMPWRTAKPTWPPGKRSPSAGGRASAVG